MSSSFVESARMIPSVSSLLSLYSSFSTSLMLLRNVYHEIVPEKLESFLASKLRNFFSRRRLQSSYDTFIVDDSWEGLSYNELIEIARFYLSTKIGPKNKIVKIGKFTGRKGVTAGLMKGETIIDVFEGIEITWYFDCRKDEDGCDEYIELTFEHKYREKVLNEYLHHVILTHKAMTEKEQALRIYNKKCECEWKWIDFKHAATFDTLAMDYELKKSIMDDLDSFLARKDYYKRTGRAWKRGYLLYGPPGTGKTSLIAAMANYLNYNVYDLELANIGSDTDLRRTMLNVDRKSIIVIEDVDCNSSVHRRSKSDRYRSRSKNVRFSLSSLLNCIDGLWSSCAQERIVVFTTNHKEVLDPALLRPGRMDMHIQMSYCTTEGFRVLVSNYLGIKNHLLFEEIDGLIRSVEATPASLADELMKSDDADVAIGEVLKFLKQKRLEKDEKMKTEESSPE